MLKKRLIPVQLLAQGRLVKSVRFADFRDVGDPVASSKVYNAQNADELVFLNVDRTERSIEPLKRVLERVSEVTFMPLALGGGIRSFADAAELIAHGADKVVITSAAVADPSIVRQVADAFGSQAVIVGVDVRMIDGSWRVCSNCAQQVADLPFTEHLDRIVAAGAGELLIQSVDHDGTMHGYDHTLIAAVVQRCHIPVIGLGGAGHYQHLSEAFTATNCAALACGSLFNFGDSNPLRAKAFLVNQGIPCKVV